MGMYWASTGLYGGPLRGSSTGVLYGGGPLRGVLYGVLYGSPLRESSTGVLYGVLYVVISRVFSRVLAGLEDLV